MIYTSYFAKNRMLVKNGIVGISIALYTPKYWHGAVYKKLAPTSAILEQYKKSHDKDVYQTQYKEAVLGKLDPKEVVKELKALAGKHDIALLCYETPLSFCHRYLAGRWLLENGISCEEFEEA